MKLLVASILCLCDLALATHLTDPCVLCLRQDLCSLRCEHLCSAYQGSIERCWTCLSATEDCARRCGSVCGHGRSLTPPPASMPTVVPTVEVETDLEDVAELQPLLTPGSLEHSLEEQVERYLFPEYGRGGERADMEHLMARLLHQSGHGLGRPGEMRLEPSDMTRCGQCLVSVGVMCSICRHPCVYTALTQQQCGMCLTDFSCLTCHDMCLGNRREWDQRLDWEGDRMLNWEGDRRMDWEGDRRLDWEVDRRMEWEGDRLDWEGDRRGELYGNQRLSWLNKVGCYSAEKCDESGYLGDVTNANMCCTLPSRDKTKPLYIQREWFHRHYCYRWHCRPELL